MFQRLLQVSGRSRSGAACSVYGCMQRGWLVWIGERFRESGRFQIMKMSYPPIPHISVVMGTGRGVQEEDGRGRVD